MFEHDAGGFPVGCEFLAHGVLIIALSPSYLAFCPGDLPVYPEMSSGFFILRLFFFFILACRMVKLWLF